MAVNYLSTEPASATIEFEGTISNLIIGVLSIALAFVVSIALSYFMGEFIGHISFRTPLALTISLLAILIWVLIVVIGSCVATITPGKKSKRSHHQRSIIF